MPELTIGPVKFDTPATMMPRPLVAATKMLPVLVMPPTADVPKVPTFVTTIPPTPAVIVPLLVMPPIADVPKVPTFVTRMPARAAVIVPLLVMPPANVDTPQLQPTTIPDTAVMAPILTMLPTNCLTFSSTRIPAPPAEMVPPPALLILPKKV